MTLVKNWTDLNAWQKAHQLVIEIYKITKLFPKDELYALTSQIRRAAVSIAANIVEGFHRKTKKDRVNFYTIALTSLEEVKYYIIISKDLQYIDVEKARELYALCNEVGRLLRRWIQTQK
ncbi:MAG: four helix bundle protein [Candidatus Magasanikbacteria bacterium]|nr:four helix bundle protein [Candidatus Magasanikbacteria bacterium]